MNSPILPIISERKCTYLLSNVFSQYQHITDLFRLFIKRSHTKLKNAIVKKCNSNVNLYASIFTSTGLNLAGMLST